MEAFVVSSIMSIGRLANRPLGRSRNLPRVQLPEQQNQESEMKVAVLVKATRSSEAGVMPSTQLLANMGKYNEALVNAGILQVGEGLKPSSQGVRVRFSGTDRTVTKGPFAETNELVAGLWIWEVGSIEEAIEWVKRCPNPMDDDSDIEIRPCFGIEDF